MNDIILSKAELQFLDKLSIYELFLDLGMLESNEQIDLEKLIGIHGSIYPPPMARGMLGWYIQRGEELFHRLWPKAKKIVCKVYAMRKDDGHLKNWVGIAAGGLMAKFGVSAIVAVLVVQIAIELGLDHMCAAKAG